MSLFAPFQNGVTVLVNMLYDFRRDTADNGIGRDILCYNCSCCNNSIIADSDTSENGCVRTNPYITANTNRRRNNSCPFTGSKIVIQCGKHDLMPDQRTITNGNSSLILKTTAGIYKNMFPDMDIPSAVGIKCC